MSAHDHTGFTKVASKPPASDVSPAVGLVGLIGLLGWIMFCRNFADIAEWLNLAAPRQPLSGPYAAVMALVFSAGPMVMWSVFVDKVHRRASTGIDWDNPRPVGHDLNVSVVKIAGLWATFAILAGLYCLARWYWSGQYLFAMEIISAAAIPVIVLSVPYILWLDRVMTQPRDHAWHFGAMLLGRDGWDPEEVKKHWRAWIIKGFFSAFMISVLPGGFAFVVENSIDGILANPARLTQLCIELLFVIDVQIGTVGYLVTMRPLDAHIRSGNPFLSGWLAALICYPPLVYAFMGSDGMLAYEVNTGGWAHWLGDSSAAMYTWGALLVFLTAIYAWATAAFGIRFSNLTYRGVLTNGPYRFTRHPAYLSKNLFWWCAVMPFFVTSGSMVDVIRNTFFLGCVSAVYYWRARTEEAHLLLEDPKYCEYYDWMEQNGIVTSRLAKVRKLLTPRGSVTAQPAE
uniref:methyltransferase family protein n=1 Tax=Parerythrobacter lutipelagi TaxID=1964208 RepID=UPI0010F5EF68|nr:protein-S-isoprenylcysteine methyltransferase [Parerythrobacter lutipelagi]